MNIIIYPAYPAARRRARRRLRLLGGLAVAALTVLVAQPVAWAAASAPMVAAGRLFWQARSVRAVSTITDTTGGVATTITDSMVWLHHGASLRVFVTVSGTTVTEEVVRSGQHTCVRQGLSGPWSCTLPDLSPTLLQSFPALARNASAAYTGTGLAGAAVKQGQRCRGYRFAGTMSGIHVTGTIWIAPATGYPVEDDSTSVATVGASAGTPAMTTTTRTVFSDWNDPRLTVPAVPTA